ncbi:hypothetical protein E2Z65_06590 [Campylobacter upsaliensis]|nr:hypothetical protein [Campylobacter upsaliensis]
MQTGAFFTCEKRVGKPLGFGSFSGALLRGEKNIKKVGKKENYMQQRVKNIAYLSEVVVDLATLDVTKGLEVIMLPKGASVLSVKMEVLELPQDSIIETLTLSLQKNGLKFFENAQIAKNANDKKFLTSNIHTTIDFNDVLVLKPSAAISGGLVKVKAHFYNPSEILAEL